MGNASHTPGPWVIKFRNDHSAYISMGNPSSEHKQFDIAFDARYPSDVADARLIAAAPELLAALQGMDEAYRRAGPQLTHKERIEDLKRLIAARAAIAKATGATE